MVFCFAFLKRDEQLAVERPSDREVVNGPGCACFLPIVCKTLKRKALLLEELDYVVVTDTLTGSQRTEAGPKLYFPSAYESIGVTTRKVTLEKDEYVKVRDSRTGEIQVVKGPSVFVPSPTESMSEGVQKAVSLKKDEYVRIVDASTGQMRIEPGEQLVFPGPKEVVENKKAGFRLKKNEYVRLLDTASGVVRVEIGEQIVFPTPTEIAPEGTREAVSLKKHEFVRLTDTATGVMRVERGEQLVFPRPMETAEAKQSAFQLRKNDYVKLFDTATGVIRVEVGEQIVFPIPTEKCDNGVQEAVNVDHETAVLVVNNESGQQRLVTDNGLFVPGPLDEILQVRKLVRVEPHEVAIVRDNEGHFTFHNGATEGGRGKAFFLPPHCELVTMYWGSGTSQEDIDKKLVKNAKCPAHKVPVTKIDLRAQYAFFEYCVRTADNVELLLEGTIFWQVTNVPQMIQATGDPKGDVWYHARSALIQAISRVTLETFMAEFNDIVMKATDADDTFYKDRGVVVHNLEVTRFEPTDKKTSSVLQEIIQETTNRINRLQHQQSENEVRKEQMTGEIEIERQRQAWIQARSDNERMQAVIDGEANGLRLAKHTQTFFDILGESLPDGETRLALFKFFEEQQMATKRAEHLSSGTARVFLTPQDMNLKLSMPPE